MNKINKKIIIVLFMIVIICSAFSATSVRARTTENDVPEETVMIAYPDRPYQFFAYVQSAPSEIRSSDNSVISARKEKADGRYGKWMICLQAKKEGTATVSMKIGGKACKTNVTVTKYENPVRSVKFGDNFISGSKFNRSSRISLSYAKFAGKKVKTKITLKKGWKLSRFYFRNRQNKYQWKNGFEYFPQEGKDTTEGTGIANGKKVLIHGGKRSFLLITAENQETEAVEYLRITLK